MFTTNLISKLKNKMKSEKCEITPFSQKLLEGKI